VLRWGRAFLLAVGSAVAVATAPAAHVQDLTDRLLPGGGRVLVARDPDAARVTVRIGFPADATEDALARLAAALQEGCDQSLARSLASADGRLVIEHDGESLVAVLDVPHESHAELLAPTLRALAAPLRAATKQPDAAAPSTRLQRVDLAGRSTWLGPAPDGRASTAAVDAALLSLEAPERLDSSGAGVDAVGAGAIRSERPELGELAAMTVRRDALVLGIVGDVDVEGTLALAAECATLLPERERGPAPPTSPLVVPLTSEVWVAVEATRSVGAVVLLGRGCRADAPDTAALLVLEEYLAEALASDLAPALGIGGPATESVDRALGFRATPGFGRGGRLVAWFGGPVEELARAGVQLREFLAGVLAPGVAPGVATGAATGAATGEARLERARTRALERLAVADTPRERLLQEQRLALRGVATGTRTRLATDVSKLSAAALAEAAERYLAADSFLCSASTRPEHVADLAVLGTLVTLPEPAPASGEAASVDPATNREGERAAEDMALEQLLEALGGRAGWATVRAAELTTRLTRAGETLRVRTTLDLEGTRFVLSVEEGGDTVLDEAGAVWRCLGDERRLDEATLALDARLGLLGLLHRLARGGSTTVQRAAEGLVVEVDGTELCLLELDAEGRPARLSTRAGAARAWRFEGWQAAGALRVPARIIDELRGVTTEVDTCRFLERYEPAR
jgi:hypothetical protein